MTNVPKPLTPDRRRHPRTSLNGCKAVVRPGLLSRLRGVKPGGLYPVVNLSKGGMLLLAPKPIPDRALVNLRVTAEAFIDTMRFKAKVVWTAKVKGKKVYRIGVKFVKVDKDTQPRLHSLTHDLYFRMKQKNKDFR